MFSKPHGLLPAALAALLVLTAAPASADIFDYVAAPDDSYAWEVAGTGDGYVNLSLVSQTWQGIEWQHTVTVFLPAQVRHPDLATLFITGGSFSQGEIALIGSMVAQRTGAPFAILWDIPNQPLWDRNEDELIAHTLVRFMETGDASWPLLFPMTKSAVRAMDALQDWSAQAQAVAPIERFVTSGASKRGWTTWFTGVVDDRVAGIAPLVYDNLDLPAQMANQWALWNDFSPMIGDYTEQGFPQALAGENADDPAADAMRTLAALIDPFTYRDRVTEPKLIINGASDPYWTVDALNLYRDELVGPVHQLLVPNAGHGLDGGLDKVLAAMVGFIDSVAQGDALPEITWEHALDGDRATLALEAPGAAKATLWYAVSTDNHFEEATWQAIELDLVDGRAEGMVARPAVGALALYAEVVFPGRDGTTATLPLSTTVALHAAP